MRNISNQYKTFTEKEKEHHHALYDELTGITDRVARYVLAGEIVRDMRSLDDFIGV